MRKQITAAVFAAITTWMPAVAQEMHHGDSGQALVPPHSVEMYLDGFHNYQGQDKLAPEKQAQVRVAHYCHPVNADLFQCIVYNGNTKDAKLVGIEYVVSNKAYQALPADEKKYWHPHDVEVASGMLRMPGMDPQKEKDTLAFLSSTWGKTWNVWQPGDQIPVGEPKLMWSVKAEHINAHTKAEMEKRLKDPSY